MDIGTWIFSPTGSVVTEIKLTPQIQRICGGFLEGTLMAETKGIAKLKIFFIKYINMPGCLYLYTQEHRTFRNLWEILEF